jgi:hypothetical protein
MILAACMILPPVAFMRRVHRTTITLRLTTLRLSALWLSALVLATLRFAALRLAALLAIHGRTAKAIAAMFRATILRRILRSAPPIALRLCAIARACHVRAALWLRTGCIAIPLLAGARLILRHRGRRKWVLLRSRHRWRRLVCGLGILRLQRRDAESERTTKPEESVGLGFHERAVLVDCGSINSRQGQEFHTHAPLR